MITFATLDFDRAYQTIQDLSTTMTRMSLGIDELEAYALAATRFIPSDHSAEFEDELFNIADLWSVLDGQDIQKVEKERKNVDA